MALRGYGFNLGVAFQLIDDVLDFTADRAALGKPVGGDLREGKVTLAAIHLLRREGRESRAHDIVRSVVETGEIGTEEWRELVGLLRERHAIQYAYDAATWSTRRPPSSVSKRSRRLRSAPCSVCCPTSCLPATARFTTRGVRHNARGRTTKGCALAR